MNWILLLTALVSSMGAEAFPDDAVTWSLTNVEYVDVDTGAIIYDAVPSVSVGCTAPRFVADIEGVLLAVYCQDGQGEYFLLFD